MISPKLTISVYITLALFSAGAPNKADSAQSDDRMPDRVVFHCADYNDERLREMSGGSRTFHNIEELAAPLEKLYHALALEGYPLARLDSVVYRSELPGNVLDLFISTAEPVKLRVGTVGGSGVDRRTVSSRGRLNEYEIRSIVDAILGEQADAGFPFARVTVVPDSLLAGSESIRTDLDFRVDRGSYIRLRRIKFPGAVTESRLLRLESRLRSREAFSRTKLERAVKRLERLPFVDFVGTPRFEPAGSGLVNLLIPVKERRVNRLSGVLSTAPGLGEPTGEVRIHFGNILGTGRKLNFEWLGLDPDRKGILVSYREPWIFSHPWHAVLELEHWTEDTLTTATRYKFGLEWEPSDRLIFSGSATSERIGGGGDIQGSDTVLRSIWIEGGISYDRLDYRWNPVQGYRMEISSAAGWRRGGSVDSRGIDLKRETAALSAAQPLIGRAVLFERFAVRDVSGAGIVSEDLVRFGGIGSVRGYAESAIPARGAGWGTVELRWRPDRDEYVGLFGDVGCVYREDTRFKPVRRTPVSFGVTAIMRTKAGKLGLDMALADGEPLRNARLHVRLESLF